ncbi:MAG: hypothetical protein EXR07_21825 [Acetobacteraceae bacterium]|nr:hypothetical protein [Acetobacteraceae bacterium]
MRPEQVIAALRFDPLQPVWLIAAIAAAAAFVCLLALWRRAKGAVIRVLAFTVLILWLSGPRVVRETRETLQDIGLLVIDQTASMQVGDRLAIAEAAQTAVREQARQFPDLELRTVTLAEKGNAGTLLFAEIERAVGEIPRSRLAGIVAITDGQIHDVPDAVPGGVPLNVLIPAKGEEIDRRLRIVEAPGFGIVGKPVTLRFTVDDLGTSGRGQATLTVRRDGEPPAASTVPTGREQRIEIPITRAGPTIVELSVSPLTGEVSPLNNRAVVEINGVRDRLRVLLISGEPHPGERAWRRLLKADPSVDLVHFTILRPPEKDDLTPLNELALIAFPVRELFQDKIGEFDLIILDRFQNRSLLPMPYLANIANRVRLGGAVLLSVGPEFSGLTSLAATPLGAVLPGGPARFNAVVNERFQPMVSDVGQRHPVTAGLTGANPPEGTPRAGDPRAPGWGSWHRRIQPGDMRGSVLMTTPDGQPLLALDRVGQGRAALLLSDQIWLWSRGHDGGGPQGELLRRIAHWLMREPALEENALTARVNEGRLAVQRRSTDPAPPGAVTVTDPDGKAQTIPLSQTSPGQAAASVPATTPGVWQVTDGAQTAFAAAGAADPPEIADLRATATVVGKLARESGGGVHWLGARAAIDVPALRRTEPDRPASGGSWIGMQRRRDNIVTGVASLTLLPAWLSVPVILALLVLAWRREGA